MKSKYILIALLSIMILFTSLPVSAAEISGNDVNNGIMLLSVNDGIDTSGSYYPNSILNDSVTKSLQLSYFTDIINLDFKICDIYFNGDSDFYSRCNLLDLYFPYNVTINNTDIAEVPPSIVNFKLYVNINGKKYYFINQWESIVPDDFIFSAVGHFGIELQINNKNNEFLQYFNLNITGDATKNTYYTDRYDYDLSGSISGTHLTQSPGRVDVNVSWTGVEWDIRREINTVSGIISNIYNHIVGWSSQLTNQLIAIESNILTKIQSVFDNITNQFTTLFSKMEEDQEEIISGFDSSTGDTTDTEFNQSTDALHAAEDNLFDSASNDLDYDTYKDFFSITSVAGSMLFVSSWLQSIYNALGIFGTPIIIGLVLLVVTRIIGFQNFTAGGG